MLAQFIDLVPWTQCRLLYATASAVIIIIIIFVSNLLMLPHRRVVVDCSSSRSQLDDDPILALVAEVNTAIVERLLSSSSSELSSPPQQVTVKLRASDLLRQQVALPAAATDAPIGSDPVRSNRIGLCISGHRHRSIISPRATQTGARSSHSFKWAQLICTNPCSRPIPTKATRALRSDSNSGSDSNSQSHSRSRNRYRWSFGMTDYYDDSSRFGAVCGIAGQLRSSVRDHHPHSAPRSDPSIIAAQHTFHFECRTACLCSPLMVLMLSARQVSPACRHQFTCTCSRSDQARATCSLNSD